MVPINYLAVLVSTVVMIVLGSLWYGPLFGKKWIALMGFDMNKVQEMQAKGMGAMWKSYALMGLGALIMSFVLANSISFTKIVLGTTGMAAGMQAAFWNWLGFIVPVSLGTVLWEGKPWKLWFLNAGYYLVGLLLIGTLLAVWM